MTTTIYTVDPHAPFVLVCLNCLNGGRDDFETAVIVDGHTPDLAAVALRYRCITCGAEYPVP